MARRKKQDWRDLVLGLGVLGSIYVGFSAWTHVRPRWLALTYAALPLTGSIVLMILIDKLIRSLIPHKTNRRGSERVSSTPRSSGTSSVRSDEELLHSPLRDLNPYEFERLLALYFRDHGYGVEERGGPGDGGVDLILTDKKTGERIAVQAKQWSDHNPVRPATVRELDSSRKNTRPGCHTSWLITSSDLTQQARLEADQRHMRFWHGGMLEYELSKWPKRQPQKGPGKLSRAKGH